MIIVLFALYGIFDMGIRVFSFGNDKVEATERGPAGYGEDGARDPGRLPPSTGSTAGSMSFSIRFRRPGNLGADTPGTTEHNLR